MWSANGTRTSSDRNPPQSPPNEPNPYMERNGTLSQLPVSPRRQRSQSPHEIWNGTLTSVPRRRAAVRRLRHLRHALVPDGDRRLIGRQPGDRPARRGRTWRRRADGRAHRVRPAVPARRRPATPSDAARPASAVSSTGRRSGETGGGPRPTLRRLDLAVLGRSSRREPRQQALGRGSDVLDGAIERFGVRLRGLARAADLADVLQARMRGPPRPSPAGRSCGAYGCSCTCSEPSRAPGPATAVSRG